ncbi:MAG: hypothetical protein WAV31_00325 [Candidatus Moraniibacteriota bacterium]
MNKNGTGQDVWNEGLSQFKLEKLKNRDEYAQYFNQLYSIFQMLLAVFQCQAVESGRKNYEPGIVTGFLEKLLGTIRALRRKYTYDPEHTLIVDLSDSGFPSYQEIGALEVDLRMREQKLNELPSLVNLKSGLLDFMFKQQEESPEILAQLGQRYFFEKLDPSIFLTFIPGNLILTGESEEFRHYIFSWAGYDFASNKPNICIMAFDQDQEANSLTEKGPNYDKFLEIVQAEGSRVPPIGIMAMGIDQNLKDIHPKSIKRIMLGPICTKSFSRDPYALHNLLVQNAESPDDFIFTFCDEIVISQEQKRSKSPFSLGQLREIFYIPETDLECYEKKASQIHHYMLLPHYLRQLMDKNGDFAAFKDTIKYTYNEENIYAGKNHCSLSADKRTRFE